MMTIDEFRLLHARMASEKRKLFQLATPDSAASEADVSEVEKAIGATLPQSYKQFLREFGGGEFGLTNVNSADRGSDYYLPRKQEEAKSYLPAELLPISDDYAGGLYVLKVEHGGAATEPVHYWNSDGGLETTQFANVLEFVARYAYQAA